MASSSTSSIPKSFTYDVFLSFRGEDTRKNFVDHLYHALVQENIHTFKDDKNMEKGERISTELIKAIEDSRFHIIVFSKNYASSSWCLDELVKIMECRKTTEQKAYPIFYDVEPSQIRKQSGAVGEAFAKHRNEVDARKWRNALEEAAGLIGWELKNIADGHEVPFIQIVVKEISQKLPFINSSVDENLVGMGVRINDIVSSLETSADDVRIIGIKGIGGGGKTTLARAVFDQISSRFEGKSFVENVSEVSKSSLSGLKSLQEQVLLNVLNKGITVSGVLDGKTLMKEKIHGKKVLVVLDDVDHINQLEALAGELSWFKSGSRIIITTRDEQVLIAYGVKLIHDVNLLSHEEAIQLFNRFAFKGEIPNPRYKKLSQQVVRYAAGLPLTIKVLGSDLKGKDELEWNDTLERLKTIPLKETLKQLELSYMGLEPDYKDIFLDVACFWKGRLKDDAIRALENCNLHPILALAVLERKSLVTVSKHRVLGMHDSIQEMGRDIVRREHRDEPHKHSRLWINEEIENILLNDLGTEATRCISMMVKFNQNINMKGLRKMKNLRFLHLFSLTDHYAKTDDDCEVDEVDEVSQYFPDALQYLFWREYPFRCLPNTFRAKNLVGLEMRYHGTGQLWESGEREVLNKLKYLVLDYSMLRTLDLGVTPNLETLSLIHCYYFEELHIPHKHPKLKSLHLTCSKLKSFDLRQTPNLEILRLEECDHLVELHFLNKCLKLEILDITGSKLRTLDFRGTLNIKRLSLVKCYALLELHMPVEFPKLETFHIFGSKLRTLDFRGTLNLKRLSLENCVHLLELHMPVEFLKLEFLKICGSKLRTLEFRQTSSLDPSSLVVEVNLVKLDINIKGSKLKTLDLKDVWNLETLSLRGCYDLGDLNMVGGGYKLRSLNLGDSSSRFTTFLFEKIRMSRNIQITGTLNNDLFSPLRFLEELTLSSLEIKYLPNGICVLKYLKSLKIESCCLLETITEDLVQLECLKELILSECIFLRDIPSNICKMKSLRYINLRNCFLVEKLPEELGYLECLEELNIEGTCICKLPQSIIMLKHRRYFGPRLLRIVGSRSLLQSCGFTSEIQTSEEETFCYIQP